VKREVLIRVAPSTLRKLANYALEYASIEKENGYDEGGRARYLHIIRSAAKRVLLDTSKRRLNLRPDQKSVASSGQPDGFGA
jgi:hypothetical protein